MKNCLFENLFFEKIVCLKKLFDFIIVYVEAFEKMYKEIIFGNFYKIYSKQHHLCILILPQEEFSFQEFPYSL